MIVCPGPRSARVLPGGTVLDQRAGGRHEHALVTVLPPDHIRRRAVLSVDPPNHRDWLAKSETVQGSRWPDYTTWLESRSGDMQDAPSELGSAKHPPLDPAPVSYILQK